MGSAMSGFAITIWAWQEYNSATVLAIVGVCTWVPGLIFGPFAGALVDRWNRKLVMMLSDLVSGLTTVAILIIYLTRHLEIWQLMRGRCHFGCVSGFSMAGLFRRHLSDDPQKTLRPRQRNDVYG